MGQLNKKYTLLWVVWILAFGVIEYAALKNDKDGDTLTAHIRKLLGTKTPGRNWENWLARVAFAGLIIWSVPHFYTGAV